jgi:hypothetical protein
VSPELRARDAGAPAEIVKGPVQTERVPSEARRDWTEVFKILTLLKEAMPERAARGFAVAEMAPWTGLVQVVSE